MYNTVLQLGLRFWVLHGVGFVVIDVSGEDTPSIFQGHVVRELPFPSRWEVKRVKFTVEQAMNAKRGNRGIALLFL